MRDDALLVYIHGWGLDATLWQGLRRALPGDDGIALDLGFRGEPNVSPLPEGRRVIAVGHSLGVLWLLMRRPFAWERLVSINGFPRFTEAEGFAPAVPRRLLERMISRFGVSPDAVTADFLKRCGTEAPVNGLRPAALLEGLEWLRDWDAREELARETAPVLALAGGRDSIVSPAMAALCFGRAANVDLRWHQEGGHLLPASAPDWCAEQIVEFLET